MNTSDNTVSFEKDYILSCATLFSEIGFPKSAFIKMIGTEYASDIFQLMNEGRLVMQGNIFTYPQRDKRKKRINQEAKRKFYTEIEKELSNFVTFYYQRISETNQAFSLTQTDSTALTVLRNNNCAVEEADKVALKYHKNLGQYLCATISRAINKVPLDSKESYLAYRLLGWYYSIIYEYEQADIAFSATLDTEVFHI